jgi:hypothetical protein
MCWWLQGKLKQKRTVPYLPFKNRNWETLLKEKQWRLCCPFFVSFIYGYAEGRMVIWNRFRVSVNSERHSAKKTHWQDDLAFPAYFPSCMGLLIGYVQLRGTVSILRFKYMSWETLFKQPTAFIPTLYRFSALKKVNHNKKSFFVALFYSIIKRIQDSRGSYNQLYSVHFKLHNYIFFSFKIL